MPIADDDLIALLRKEEEAASGYQDSALSAIREEALSYYDRQPYGDEQEGASSVVTSEFADVIESLMPGLMRVFTGSDDLCKFAPIAPGQEKWAREASEYVPHVLMRQNDGFRVISSLLKDALMYRLSGVTVDLEDFEDRRVVPVQGLTRDAVDLIVAEAQHQGAELAMELAPDPASPEALQGMPPHREDVPAEASAGSGGGTFSGTITVTHKRKRVVVESIAPEDILFSPAARDEDKASFLGFTKRVTSSDLVKLGLTPDEIDDLSSDRDLSAEAAQRNEGVLDETERTGEDDSERPLWLVVAYIRVDDDGDGVSELLRVVYAHGGGPASGATAGRIIERVEWSGPASSKWSSVWKRFRRWAKKGVFERIFAALSRDADFEYAFIDGTIVKVHRHGTGAKGDSKSGHRQVARRPDHQDHGAGRRARQSRPLRSSAGSAP